MASFPTFELEVLIDQFTIIPSPKQTGLIPEIRWINARTVFPEPTTIGTTTLTRITPANPFTKNQYLIKREVVAEDYLSAKRIVFYETEQALDILSIVSQRGFKMLRITPPQPKTNNIGQTKKNSLRDKLIAWSNKQLKSKPTQLTPIDQFMIDEKGQATIKLQPYMEYTLELKEAGRLQEYITFTHDAQSNQLSKIHYFNMTTKDMQLRISEANTNYLRISSLGNVTTAIRFYRMSLQSSDYLTRFVLLWSALESACNLRERCGFPEKMRIMSNEIVTLPKVHNLEKANEVLTKLNWTRNQIVHNPQITRQEDFKESLPESYSKLNWLCINLLLDKLSLTMLHENASPL